MNPLWSLFFKDRLRTPFSVYKMSLAEVVFLLATIGGIGWGLGTGVAWIINAQSAAEEAESVVPVVE
jgi:ABC-type antimicrobial peptide transport system permease subunit